MHKPKRVITSKVLHKNPLFQVRQDKFIRANEKHGLYYSVIADPFVLICALTPDRKSVYIVKSWRYPLGRYLWEFPKGWREKNETPLMSAKRELAEEVGVTAKKWKKIGWFFLAPGITNQKGYVFVAERLEPIKSFTASDEIVEKKTVKLATLKKMIDENKFLDCASQAAAEQLFEYLER